MEGEQNARRPKPAIGASEFISGTKLIAYANWRAKLARSAAAPGTLEPLDLERR